MPYQADAVSEGSALDAIGGGHKEPRSRRWKASAGLIGALMFSLAFAGLCAIFVAICSIQDMSTSLTTINTMDEPRTTSAITSLGTEYSALEKAGEGISAHRAPSAQEAEERWREEEGDGGEERVQGEDEGGGEGVAAKPNVFFIMIDDMGWNDIGYQSTDLAGITPNLDKLAAGGVKMAQYYTMHICTPARASLMTGRYPVRYGMQYSVIQPGAPWGLPLTEKIFPQYMGDAGYETHMVGKWHLGSYTHMHTPHKRGFETFLGFLNDEEMYWTHQSYTAILDGRKFFDFGFGNATGYYDIIDRQADGDDDDTFTTGPTSTASSSGASFDGMYSTSIFQSRAIEIIGSKTPNDEEPLFLYLSHQAVHDPLGLPPDDAFTAEEWEALEKLTEVTDSAVRIRFAKVLMYLDKTIGELVSYLEDEGWMENSIIVVASDNGGCPTSGGSNYPLRGLKHSYWEGGTKVPAFVYSRSHIPEELWGSEYHGLMHVTDWLPTLASVSGVELTGSHGELDGLDHWDYIVNKTDSRGMEEGEEGDEFEEKEEEDDGLTWAGVGPRTEVLYNYDPYNLAEDWSNITAYPTTQGAFRMGRWKLALHEFCSGWYSFNRNIAEEDPLTNHSNTCQDLGTCSACPQACLGHSEYQDWLFDLEADPREEHNVIDLYPEVAAKIRSRFSEVVLKEYIPSSYKDIAYDSYYVWAKHNWWMVPWYSIVESTDDNTLVEGFSKESGGDGPPLVSTSWTSSFSS